MMFRNQLFAAFAACLAVSAIPPNAAAQQTTPDGVLLENAVNRPERPYRTAGPSDPRDRGPHVAKGFGSATGVLSASLCRAVRPAGSSRPNSTG